MCLSDFRNSTSCSQLFSEFAKQNKTPWDLSYNTSTVSPTPRHRPMNRASSYKRRISPALYFPSAIRASWRIAKEVLGLGELEAVHRRTSDVGLKSRSTRTLQMFASQIDYGCGEGRVKAGRMACDGSRIHIVEAHPAPTPSAHASSVSSLSKLCPSVSIHIIHHWRCSRDLDPTRAFRLSDL
ncbi:hypothetical protein JAAARDRAFT_500492 [Jaapia argillacea MUCL 33604]|uniref:Uncharacterized protein n=1 Tax=Jaapia argillacea MUCL 33604 TaxID=933084 RepID=A0A067PCS3_9AGAM|nr:hypothetical protein JAAARDRAFT_500492 [Jaapia argillacea MUCL 33604]